MFYCNDCAKENGYPETITKSQGPCECCDKIALCNDMPSSKLPKREFYACDTETTGLNPITMSYPVGIGKVDADGKPVMKKGYPVIDVPADGEPKWYGGAFALYFVYSKYKGNFILRGYSDEVDKYLKKHYTHYLYYTSLWNAGQSRGFWRFWKDNVTILEPNRKLRKNKRYKYEIYQCDNGSRYGSLYDFGAAKKKAEESKLLFKRLPKQWIPEFDTF